MTPVSLLLPSVVGVVGITLIVAVVRWLAQRPRPETGVGTAARIGDRVSQAASAT